MHHIINALNKYEDLTYMQNVLDKHPKEILNQDSIEILYCLKMKGLIDNRIEDYINGFSSQLRILDELGLVHVVYQDRYTHRYDTIYQLTYLGQLYVDYALPTVEPQGRVSKPNPHKSSHIKVWLDNHGMPIVAVIGIAILLGSIVSVIMLHYIVALILIASSLIFVTLADHFLDLGSTGINYYESLAHDPTEQNKIYSAGLNDELTYYTYTDLLVFLYSPSSLNLKTLQGTPDFNSTTFPMDDCFQFTNDIWETANITIDDDYYYRECYRKLRKDHQRITDNNLFNFLIDHDDQWHVKADLYNLMQKNLYTALFDAKE